MNWKKEVFKNFKLYAVTDVKKGDNVLPKVDDAYRGGADIVQLRSKELSDQEIIRLGSTIRQIAHKYQKLFFINDRVDLALAAEADGVHLGQDDLPVTFARKYAQHCGVDLCIGKSTHSLEQAAQAIKENPDYIGVGPVYGTPTKPGYTPVGLKLVSEVSAANFPIPFVVIGGINLENVKEVLNAGARRVAIVRAIFATERTYENTKDLLEIIEQYQYQSV